MGMKIQFFKPFSTKVSGDMMRMVFAYQFLSIVKDDEQYWFVPVEGKEIILNLKAKQMENMSDVFVFQKGNRFIRMPLYQLILLCDGFADKVSDIAEREYEDQVIVIGNDDSTTEIEIMLQELEKMNIQHAIDLALDERDFETARKLVALCK